jgi:tetratricopeptide (TPR) repeat protein
MTRVVKFPIETPLKMGPRKVKKRRKPDPEDFGQLNLFDQSKVISFPQAENFFEEALVLDDLDDPRAENYYLKAIEARQSVPDAYCNLGILFSRKSDDVKAADFLTRCLKESPRHFEAHYNLANIYSDKGNLELAKMHYQMAIEIEPDFPNSYYNLGLVYITEKKYDMAIEAINKYIEISPQNDHKTSYELLKTLNSIA